MSAAHQPGVPEPLRRPDFLRWRRHSRLIRRLRVALPIAIGLILGSLVGLVAYNALHEAAVRPAEAETPIQLINPRFVGRDDKGRAFVITAKTATRDARDYQRVLLVEPALILDEQGAHPTRVSAKAGVYRETDRVLKLEGGVKLNGADASFSTAASVFDTATGELAGSGPISGSGSLGEIIAKSYGVYDKGERMVFKGGVRARIDTN